MRPLRISSRLVCCATGGLLVGGFCLLDRSSVGAEIAFLAHWTASSPGELNVWLGFVLLLSPGFTLIGWGLAPLLASRIARGAQWLVSRDHKQRRLVLGAVGAAACLVYGISQIWVSRGFFLLDEIASARFGGRVLASGRLGLEVPTCWQSLPHLYLHARNGFVTSFDWLGVQLVWALAELSQTAAWVFAGLSAATLIALTLVISRGLGFAWGMLGGLVFFLSPMALTLSVSNHAHIGSRLSVALTVLAFVYAQGTQSRMRWAAVGLSLGLGLLFRPFEVSLLLVPLLASTCVGDTRETLPARALAWTLAGCMPSLILMAWHNTQITGYPWLFARFAYNDYLAASNLKSQPPWAVLTDAGLLWSRFGTNFSYNLQQLIIWALGPLGALCFACGVTANRLTRLLATGMGLALLLAFAHDDSGLHVFGPLHYSDAVIPASIVMVYGVQRVYHALLAHSAVTGRDIVIAVCVGMLSAASGLGYRQLQALRYQGSIHEAIHSAVWDKKFNNSVVLAPPYEALWKRQLPTFAPVDSHLRHWQPSHPQLYDRVVVAHDFPAAMQTLYRCFPDRRFFRLYTDPQSGSLQTQELSKPDDAY